MAVVAGDAGIGAERPREGAVAGRQAVGRLAASTGVARVLLTHLQMGFDPDETLASVRAEYGGPVDFVWPGTTIDW